MSTGRQLPRAVAEPSVAPPEAPGAAGADGSALAVDAPIELQLELARFALTLGELQRVRVGDVLLTGRRIGEAVTLRAAGRPLAHGELVDVEGEVGVRLTEILLE